MFGTLDTLISKISLRWLVAAFVTTIFVVVLIYFYPVHFVRSELRISSTGYYSIDYSYTLRTISKDGITMLLETKIETKDHKNNLVEEKV